MKPGSLRAADLLLPALGLGILGRLLFYQPGAAGVENLSDPGLNMSLWVSAIVLTWYALRRRAGGVGSPLERRLLVGILVLGGAFAWRSADMLRVLDALALFVMAAVLPLAAVASDGLLASLRVGELAAAARNLVGRIALGLAPALLDVRETASAVAPGRRAILLSITRGLLLAVPPLVVFGALLASADPGFERLTRRFLSLDFATSAQHGFVTLGLGWVAAALLGGMLSVAQHLRPAPVQRQVLGAIEVGLSLGLVNLLFLAFILSQLHYFFGGHVLVRETSGLTLSAYARRGFFELVWVTALVLPLLLTMYGALRSSDPKTLTTFRLAAGGMVGLALVIVASALHRMSLYQSQFGLTEDRFFACAAIVGLAFTLVWFAVTVLGGRPLRFAGGALLAWAGWLAMLHLVNPSAVVARVNLDRAAEGKGFDVKYALELGADAVPSLMNGLSGLAPVDREQLTQRLALRWHHDEPAPWRQWTLARFRAVRATAAAANTQSPSLSQ